MNATRLLACFWLNAWLVGSCAEPLFVVRPAVYTGMADASAAVPVSSNLFVVACDEDNILRLYSSERPGPPVKQFDFTSFLRVRGKSLEADLEGAARIGNRAFWIGSHGRNKNGKERFNRCRLFATDIRLEQDQVFLEGVGQPYTRMTQDLSSDRRFEHLHLEEASEFAPKEQDALNIEGLACTPQRGLLIGFRNPIPDGKALIIPLLNPNDVIYGRPAKFGEAILMDLGGLGIRDMAFWEHEYRVLAGQYDGGGRFELYSWTGPGSLPRLLLTQSLKGYHPEALIIYPDKGLGEIQVLSDDGTRLVDGVPSKELKDPARRMFRSFWLSESKSR